MGIVQKHLRNTFLAGALAAVPLAATALLVIYIESAARQLFRIDVPFAGMIIAIAAIYLLGLIVTSVIGRSLIRMIDRVLDRLPMLRELYRAWKQVSLAASGSEGMFRHVVLVPDESGKGHVIGFTSGRPVEGDEQSCCVFLPAAPNPTSGRLCFIRREQVRYLKLSTEEAFKIILSGGNYLPPLRAAAE